MAVSRQPPSLNLAAGSSFMASLIISSSSFRIRTGFFAGSFCPGGYTRQRHCRPPRSTRTTAPYRINGVSGDCAGQAEGTGGTSMVMSSLVEGKADTLPLKTLP